MVSPSFSFCYLIQRIFLTHFLDEHSSRRVVIEPKNGFIVSEGVPGVLQFYNPVTDR